MTKCLGFFVLSFLIFVGGCKKDDPVAPPPPPPVMTGRWDYTLTGTAGSITGLLDLTENDGALSGSITIANASLPLSGTVTQSYQVTLGGQDASGRMLITGTTTSSKNTFNGKLDLWDRTKTPEVYQGYLLMTGSKR